MSAHRIVFMGTPPFAVASLRALIEAGLEVAAVVTAPDRPAGRGRQPRMSAVKEFALQHPELRHHVLQPERLRDPDFHRQLDATGADLYVVVAFRMLPESVWARPALGSINLHASLLPAYRGAAPINWAIINGETRTGVTTFFLQHEIDTGDLIRQAETTIGVDETAGELHDRLMHMGAELLTASVRAIFNGEARRMPQQPPPSGSTPHAPKLTPQLARIDPRRSARSVHDLVRGLSPVPGAWAPLQVDGQPAQHFKVLRTALHDEAVTDAPGTLRIAHGALLLQCADGRVQFLEVHPEGRRRMPAGAFIHGLKVNEGLHLELP